jgi:hypothetical protein
VIIHRRRYAGIALGLVTLLMVSRPAASQTGRVIGTVKTESGEGIKGATVRAENRDVIPPTLTATTDDKGRFTMIGLRSGRWVFEAQAPGFTPVRGAAFVQALGQSPPISFTLPKAAPVAPTALGTMEPKDILEALEVADKLAASGQHDAAIDAYEALAEKVPSLTMLKLQIARTYLRKPDVPRAIAAYEELLELEPANEAVRQELARARQ